MTFEFQVCRPTESGDTVPQKPALPVVRVVLGLLWHDVTFEQE